MNFTIEYHVTNNCNMNCSYCFAKNVRCNDKIDMKDSLDFTYKFIKSDYYKWRNFTNTELVLIGGEPTIVPDVCEDAAKFAYDNNCSVTIYTNGLEIDSIIEIFKPIISKTQFSISYDGKVTSNGHTHQDKVIENVYRLNDAGYKVGLKPCIGWDDVNKIATIYDEFNLIQNHLKNKLFFKPSFNYINPTITMNEVENILEIIKPQIEYILSYPNGINSEFHTNYRRDCGSGKNMISIDVDGTIYPCHVASCMINPIAHRMGSTKDDLKIITDKMTKYMEIEVNHHNKTCNDCESSCYNRCRIARFENSNKESYEDKWTHFDSSPELCMLFKGIDKIVKDYKNGICSIK